LWLVFLQEKSEIEQIVYGVLIETVLELGNFLSNVDNDRFFVLEVTRVMANAIKEKNYFIKQNKDLEIGKGEKNVE
jgi:hypothetical protein